jgi:SAM-dependent methyltransferase
MTATPACRFCATPLTHTLVDLGDQPLANSYLTPEALAAGTEQSFPLHARVCPACFLVQVDDVVPAEAIFDHDYAYFSSFSPSWVAHALRYAQAMVERLSLGPDSLVVEIASNDGYLLQHFVALDVPVLGIEPAGATAEAARARGVETEVAFFNEETAVRLAARGVRADLMAANNVLAHVPDISGFVAGFRHVLKPEGVLTFEFPHLLNLIEQVQFDTIYHEHFSYLSLLAVEAVLQAGGLRPFDVELLPTHGGSLRLFCCHAGAGFQDTAALAALREREAAAGLDQIATYEGFTPRVEAVRASFLDFLRTAQAEGRRVAAYGAAAKGNTFLNYCGVTAPQIVAAFDANPVKQGRYLPGSHVPVLAPDAAGDVRPDYLLILPWNLQAEIRQQLAYIADWGGRFVVASPATRVLD